MKERLLLADGYSEFSPIRESVLAAAALGLHSYYTGVERILSRVAERVDRDLPSGNDWHHTLLKQMSISVPGRPPILAAETLIQLGELCGFRHVVRSAYTGRLNPSKIHAVAIDLPRLHAAVTQDFAQFLHYLDSLNVEQEVPER